MKQYRSHGFIKLLLAWLVVVAECMPPTCDNGIYCQGNLLHTVQMAQLFRDSKHFVDMKLNKRQDETLRLFDKMMKKYNMKPESKEIIKFVNENFSPPGSEFEKFIPVDWKKHPKFLDKIKDDKLKDWADKLNRLWESLGRKMKDDVRKNPELYSIIYVPNPVIVPGGRFREFYYWDSYWIIRGLILSEMYSTVKGMLENFLLIVKKHGLVPNGGRIYYLRRAQPPLLIPMVKLYYDAKKDKKFLEENIATLEKEFNFWLSQRTVTVIKGRKKYKLAIYNVRASGPRPESYKEDYTAAQKFERKKEKNDFYCELKSAAESGWDFSSRWFIKGRKNEGNITDIKTSSIVPVDLNAMLYWDAIILSEFYEILGDKAKRESYFKIANDWLDAVTNILWDDKEGVWLDYDQLNKIPRNYFYASNLAPLWTGCYNQTDETISKVLKYIKKTKILEYNGGIPTSLYQSGEQWDFPNSWPPLVHMIIIGLDNTGNREAKTLAVKIAKKWIEANYKGFKESGYMYEKYDAREIGVYGGGGEYEVQAGFGWTNGVCLDLIDKYCNELKNVGGDFINGDPKSSRGIMMNKGTSRVVVILVVLHIFLCLDNK